MNREHPSHYGLSEEEASRYAEGDDAIPAPVLALTSELTGATVSVGPSPSQLGPCSGENEQLVVSHDQEARLTLSRDSTGAPWLIAVVISYDTVRSVSQQWCGEFCCFNDSTTKVNHRAELHLVRLALPSTKRTIELPAVPGLVQMEGAMGTFAFAPSDDDSHAIVVWQIDLDAT